MAYVHGSTLKLPPHVAAHVRDIAAENTALASENRELHRLAKVHQERAAELHDANGSLELRHAEMVKQLADAERLAAALRNQVKMLMAVPVDHRKPESVCGTHAAYVKHVRLGETPCFPCKVARANYQREYRARKVAA